MLVQHSDTQVDVSTNPTNQPINQSMNACMDTDFVRGGSHLGYIDLSVSSLALPSVLLDSNSGLDIGAPTNFFNIRTPHRMFELCTDTPAERSRWVEHLSKHTQSNSSSNSSSNLDQSATFETLRSSRFASLGGIASSPLGGRSNSDESTLPDGTTPTSLRQTRSLIGVQRPSSSAVMPTTTSVAASAGIESPPTSPRSPVPPTARTVIKREIALLRGEVLSNRRHIVDFVRESDVISGTLLLSNFRVIFLPDIRVCIGHSSKHFCHRHHHHQPCLCATLLLGRRITGCPFATHMIDTNFIHRTKHQKCLLLQRDSGREQKYVADCRLECSAY
jgi:hypothetical protein